MKKNQNKNKQSPKTKIQLKIQSRNVTNNFILTPRATSAIDQRDKADKLTEEIKVQREKKDEINLMREMKKPQYRMVFTDHPKTNTKKKYQQEETGTHTPLLKRVSNNSDIGSANKKKSTHSLINTQRSKQRKKPSSRLSNSTSGQLNKITLQRLIGVIIKDYKEGKLKQQELQQTLIKLYEHKDKKKSLGKKNKKKEMALNTFSNQFIKSAHQIRSQALVRRRKKSDQIQQNVIQRKGFVNKIIIKGITTSLFLKEDAELTNQKQKQTKNKIKEPSYQINTSNSIKEIYDDMVMLKQHIFPDKKDNIKISLQEKMVIKIQRAWRRYRTRKLLKNISKNKKRSKQQQQNFHILDEFTDEQNDQAYQDSRFRRNIVKPSQSSNYQQLINLISTSLHEKNISKEQCLKNILIFLKHPQSLIQHTNKADKSIISENSIRSIILASSLPNQQPEQVGKQSRVKVFFAPENEQQQSQQSNQLNSFTNKYSSKEVPQQNRQFFLPSEHEDTQQLDQSLIYTHSQTANKDSFKMVNIQTIEVGLQSRQESLLTRKQKQLDQLTQKYFLKKISKEEYVKQKDKSEKWFKSKQKELKKIKNSLLKSCMQAKNILENDSKTLVTEKSRKMLKCLSDKLIKKQDWLIKQDRIQRVQKPSHHLPCEQNEHVQQNKAKKFQHEDDNYQELIFNKKDKYQVEEQSKNFEISPRLIRHTSLDENQYKYQQIQKIIEEDEQGQDFLRLSHRQLQSDKFINLSRQQDGIEAQQISLINNYVNEATKKLKYLCTQDKQDIFQFLFLDLVLQMFTQLYPGQSKILRAAQVYISRAKRLRKIPKGIKTNLISCKQYLKVLHDYALKEQKCLKGLSIPMGPSASQMLRYMRDEIFEAEDDDSVASTLVLPVQIFQKLGKSKQLELKLERYYDDQEKQIARLSFLKTALHINYKALFDSLNEMLDHERPYGVWGKPFPWKTALSVDKKWTRQQEQKKLKSSVDKTVECCSYLCGILVDKQDSLFGSHRVSQEYIMQIRQDRLSKMLANDLIQNEERWIFYDDQETQILMETSAYVTKKLIKELVLQLMTIKIKL